MRKWRYRSLHANLDGFERAQCDVGKSLGGGGGSEEDHGLVGIGRELVAVKVLEDLVEAVLASALERVADEGGCPAEEDAAEPLLGIDRAPGLGVGLVEFVVDLSAAFNLGSTVSTHPSRSRCKAVGYASHEQEIERRTKSRGVTIVCVGPQAVIISICRRMMSTANLTYQ
jgi:hypothetical protein